MQDDTQTQARELTKRYIDITKDPQHKQYLQKLLDEDSPNLVDLMLTPLKLGTGGIRGVMEMGFSNINEVTINVIATSLMSYYGNIKNLQTEQNETCTKKCKIYIGYDGRYNSSFFALIFAKVFISGFFEVYVTDKPVITPFASFIAKSGFCDISVMITASHNSKEYNGVKIFLDKGCQISTPHDKKLEKYFVNREITNVDYNGHKFYSVESKTNEIVHFANVDSVNLMHLEDFLTDYCKDWCNGWKDHAAEFLARSGNTKILVSVLNGPGYIFMKKMVELYNLLDCVVFFEPHCAIDPEFSGIKHPNPEKIESYEGPIQFADQNSIDYIFMFDPDGDRFGMLHKIKYSWKLYSADEISVRFAIKAFQLFKKEDMLVVNTLYCNDLIKDICKSENIRCYQTETGFKNISGKLAIEKEKMKTEFVLAYEDSLGFAIGENIEKDGLPCAVFMAKIIQDSDHSIQTTLQEVEDRYGVFVTYKKQIRCQNPREWMKGQKELFDKKLISYETDEKKVTVVSDIKVYLRMSETESLIKVYSSTNKLTYEELKEKVEKLLSLETNEKSNQ